MSARTRHCELFAGREARRFEHRRTVTEDDVDTLGHVNNVVYVQWIQDIAGAHWRALAGPELVDSVAWALLRHEIDYKRAAYPGDELTVRTWVGTATPVRYERHVEIVDPKERLLVKSRTVWAPIDRATGRLRRLDVSAHEPFYE
ncbi:MAG: acyl-CoA thioesterase [Gemmatimonadota bacterium]|nr:acyl-CoA thioesterase [Gemmatimonadota bacterium]